MGTFPAGGSCNYTASTIAGLPTNITLFGLGGTSATLGVFTDAAHTTSACTSRRSTGAGAASSCTVDSAPATLYVNVSGTAGSPYTILAPNPGVASTASSSGSQGSAVMPLDPSITAGNDNSSLHIGASGSNSFYMIPGLTPGDFHSVAVAGVNTGASVTLKIFSGNDFATGLLACASGVSTQDTPGAPVDCKVQVPGSVTLYVLVQSTASGVATAYTMMLN